MPPGNANEGLDAGAGDPCELPDTAILVLSAHVDADQAMSCSAAATGIGYLLKCRSPMWPTSSTPLQRIAKARCGGPGVGVRRLVSGARRAESTLSALTRT